MMKTFLNLLDIFSPIATIFFGIYGAINDTKPENGKLNKHGKIALTGIILSGLITLTVGSGKYYYDLKAQRDQIGKMRQNDSIQLVFQNNVAQNFKLSLDTLSKVTKKQDKNFDATARNLKSATEIHREVLKSYFPLDPLTIKYEISYSMTLPIFNGYLKRLQTSIVREWNSWRVLGDTLKSFSEVKINDLLFNLNNIKNALPLNNDSESEAFGKLMIDFTSFQFLNDNNRKIVLSSIHPSETGLFVQKVWKDSLKQKIELFADFENKRFIKKVTCINPMRSGNDILALSSVDLVGRKMTWGPFFVEPQIWKLESFGFLFSYDYKSSPFERIIKISNKNKFVIIKAKDLGLEEYSNSILSN